MEIDPRLVDALGESQRLGMLGARPIPEVIEHAMAFVGALEDVRGRVVDLGSGGGVPGLVVAVARPDLEIVLVDRRTKRTDLLSRLVARLGLRDRVEVVSGDAERLIDGDRTVFDAATARGFGPPKLTLEVGVSAVRPGGLVIISEPPEGDRWNDDVVGGAGAVRRPGPDGVAVFERLANP